MNNRVAGNNKKTPSIPILVPVPAKLVPANFRASSPMWFSSVVRSLVADCSIFLYTICVCLHLSLLFTGASFTEFEGSHKTQHQEVAEGARAIKTRMQDMELLSVAYV